MQDVGAGGQDVPVQGRGVRWSFGAMVPVILLNHATKVSCEMIKIAVCVSKNLVVYVKCDFWWGWLFNSV